MRAKQTLKAHYTLMATTLERGSDTVKKIGETPRLDKTIKPPKISPRKRVWVVDTRRQNQKCQELVKNR